MQNRIRILLSMMLALAIILSLATGALATEQEHVHNWQRTKADVMFHTMVCSDCGESKTITHSFDGTECCSVCGYQVHECVWQYGGEFYDYSHKLTCTKCDSTSTAAHNYGSDGKCTVCGQPPPHIHDWKWDGKHTYDRYHMLICACGQTADEGHKIGWDGKTYNEMGHKMTCIVCGDPSISWYYVHNIYDDGICNVCGYGGKDATQPTTNSTQTNPTETKAEGTNPTETKVEGTNPTETKVEGTNPTETKAEGTNATEGKPAGTEPAASETIPENGDFQPSSTVWIWVAVAVVVAGGLGVGVFIRKKKSS